MLNIYTIIVCLSPMMSVAVCNDFDDYLFAGSDKVTILTNYPVATSEESNPIQSKKPGFFSKIKSKVGGLIFKDKSTTEAPPEMELSEGTYDCSTGKCVQIPGDEKRDYERIKQESSRTTTPGENDLTKLAGKAVNFIDPPEILKNINPEGMLKALDDEYKSKNELKNNKQPVNA